MSAPFLVSYVSLWILVAFQALILVGLVVALQRLQRTLPAQGAGGGIGLPQGSEVPDFRARDVAGLSLSSKDLLGRLTALLFVSPSCSSCHTTLEDMTALDHKARGNVIVISRGTKAEVADLASTYALRRAVPDPDGEIANLFGITRVPMAVLVDRSGHVQSYGHPFSAAEFERASAEARAGQGEAQAIG